MKCRMLVLMLFLSLTGLTSLGEAADLWHLMDDENGSTLAYIYRNESEVIAYSTSWKKYPVKESETGNDMECSFPFSGNLKINIYFRIVDSSLEGDWVLAHPQAKEKKSFKYQKIRVGEDWLPMGILHGQDDNEVIDIFTGLKKRADTLSRKEFEDYWIESFEPDYYAIFTLILYREKGFGFSEQERKDEAGRLYDSLREAPDVDLGAVYQQVLLDITHKYPWFEMKRGVLIFPCLDNPRLTQLTLDKMTPRKVINTSFLFEEYNARQIKYYLAETIMYDYFQYNSSLAGNGPVEDFILLSVSLNLISDLDYGEPADYLFLNDKAALEGIVKRYHEIRKNFMKETKGGQAWRRAEDEKLSEYYYLGYQFGGLLLEVYKPEDLRSYRNMNTIKRSFANFLKYDDSKVKQLPLR